MSVEGNRCDAHRLSWEMQYGPIPRGMVVMHTCDVRRCVNPFHLVLGTVAENNRDRDKKGRQAKGEAAGRAKLTEDQVRVIRDAVTSGAATKAALARRFGVSRERIGQVVSGRGWTHVAA